jgi:hypothetical protein
VRTPRIYATIRHPVDRSSRFYVVDEGKLTILVMHIIPDAVTVIFNPNLKDYKRGLNTQSFEVEYTNETQAQTMRIGDRPLRVPGADREFEVSLVEIDSEQMPGVAGRMDYCVFDVVDCP